MPASLLLSRFLPLSAIRLGRFVTNVDEPHRDYYDAKDSSGITVIEKVEVDSASLDSSAAYHGFASELTSLLSASFSKRHKSSIRIVTNRIKTYYLDNNGEWFRDIIKTEDLRRWIEQIIDEGEDIYFVVGVCTITDASVEVQAGGQVAVDGKLVLPVSTALAAAGVVVPIDGLTDPSLANRGGHAEDEKRQFTAPGEQVFAVQYRKVCFKWFSGKVAEKARLAKKTQWERYDRPRYLRSDGNDRIEVDLEDNLALEGLHEKYIARSGESCYSVLYRNGEEE